MDKKQEEYIRNHWNEMSSEDLRKQFNNIFGTSYKTTAFHYHTNRLGLSKWTPHKYTQEQDEFLKNNSNTMSRSELTEAFNKKYETHIKENAIIQRCFLNGWKPQTDGKFHDGSVPWEKTAGGREEYVKTLKGGNAASFRKGNIPHNTLDIGTVKWCGHLFRTKTDDGWKTCLRLLWEQNYGKIPKGYAVISVDGDPDTKDVEKLRIIPNRTLTVLMSNNWYGKGAEIVDTGIAWSNLHFALK